MISSIGDGRLYICKATVRDALPLFHEPLDTICKAIKNPKPQRRAHLAFLDIKSAYDSVPRAVLWRRLEALGMQPALLGILRALFEFNSAQLVIGGHLSCPFGLPAGVLSQSSRGEAPGEG